MSILLAEEQRKHEIECILTNPKVPLYSLLDPLVESACISQARKIFDELEKPCLHYPPELFMDEKGLVELPCLKRECPLCIAEMESEL
jgi:hypothetical protein